MGGRTAAQHDVDRPALWIRIANGPNAASHLILRRVALNLLP